MAKKIGRSAHKAKKKAAARPKKRVKADKIFTEYFALIQAQRDRERAEFQAAVESLRSAPPLERAEGVLSFWANKLAEWGDHEAVVYLISRGVQPSQFANSIIANWREAEREVVDRVVGTDRSSWAQSVRQNPTIALAGFWNSFDSQQFSIDATMLRTNEWCRLAGFEHWWKEIAKGVQESAFSGGSNLYFLFNMCRSDLAIHLMNDELSLALRSIEALYGTRHPWLRHGDDLGSAIGVAASFLFAGARAGSTRSGLCEPALYELRRHFDARIGAWPAFSERTGTYSVEATAMALHALNVANVPDWEHYASPAAHGYGINSIKTVTGLNVDRPTPCGSRSSY
jgi:hypothetical protein